jgi:Flp pilus assembly protein TadG
VLDAAAPLRAAGGSARRLRGDGGAATSLSVALLTPMFLILAFAAFQAAMWSHAKTEARVVARDTAALVARSSVAEDDAEASATAILEADTDLRNVAVTATSTAGVVTVTVTADAPGIVRGTSTTVSVTSAVPIEELTP